MATPVIMPRQGQSVESCIISKWHKKKGDKVQRGEVLFTYETDKATFEEEAKEDGVILDIFFEEGDDVPVLTNVCVIGNPGEDTAQFIPGGQEGPKEEKEEKIQAESVQAVNMQEAGTGEGRIRISPRARNLAERIGIDYRQAVPTGPNGRIIERDILALQERGAMLTPAAAQGYKEGTGTAVAGTGIGGRITTDDMARVPRSPSVAAEAASQASEAEIPLAPLYEEIQLSHIRKVIAKTMHQSLSNTAQLTLHTSFDASEILAYRKKIKEGAENLELENITLTDMILYAVSKTLLRHKALNAHFLDDRMRIFSNVHLGVAVDTDRGLMVPTIFNANTKSLNEIAGEAKKLAQECKKGTINPDLLQGGSFTVTNLGTLEIESFTPVLNPPQTGILGVNTIVQRVKEVEGEMVYYPAMGLSLTFDHRALDGAPAARFLKDLKTGLENFTVLLAR